MNERTVVMLSDAGIEPRVARDLASEAVRVDCYARLEDLFGERDPGAIPVLVFHLRERPRGRVLEVIGRLAIEHPRVQMAAVSERELPLEVAEYLAEHGVEVLEPGGFDGIDGLREVVERMHERRDLCLACC